MLRINLKLIFKKFIKTKFFVSASARKGHHRNDTKPTKTNRRRNQNRMETPLERTQRRQNPSRRHRHKQLHQLIHRPRHHNPRHPRLQNPKPQRHPKTTRNPKHRPLHPTRQTNRRMEQIRKRKHTPANQTQTPKPNPNKTTSKQTNHKPTRLATHLTEETPSVPRRILAW